jgi:hypothetical protein
MKCMACYNKAIDAAASATSSAARLLNPNLFLTTYAGGGVWFVQSAIQILMLLG